MSNWIRTFHVLAVMLVVVLTGSWRVPQAAAQASPSIIIQPWEDKPHWAESYDDLMFVNKGHLKGEPDSLKVFYWDSYGRIKFDREDNDPGFALGYRILTVSFDSDHRDLPGNVNDVALAAAFRVGQIGDDWRVSATTGLGTANDGHWSNSDAVYGIGAVDFGTQLDERSALHLGLSYDGNRAILPDIPLPYVTYHTQLNEQLMLQLGVPVSSVVWRPTEQVRLSLSYVVPVNFRASAQWRIVEWFELFSEYDSSTDGFWLDRYDNRRLFYSFQRVQAGMRFIFDPYVDASIGVGYIFDQEFSRGFDLRSDSKLFAASDEIFLLFRVQGTF